MAIQRAAAVALLCIGCTQAPPGRRLASGIARGLIARDGAVAFLLDASHPADHNVPDDLLAGDLWLDDRKVGSGVSTGDGAYAFCPRAASSPSSEGALPRGEGELWVAQRGAAPRLVAKVAVLRLVVARRAGVRRGQPGRLGDRSGRLRVRPWRDRRTAVACRPRVRRGRRDALGGGSAIGSRARVAVATSGFRLAPTGDRRARPAAGQGRGSPDLDRRRAGATATAFAFAGRPGAGALSSGSSPEAAGELPMPRAGGERRLVGSRVTDFRWSSGATCCLARYDLRARAGTLTVRRRRARPGDRAASGFAVRRRVLYVVQAPQKGDFKLELWAADLADTQRAPHRVDEGAYGWQPSPDGATVYYKARCAGGARSCSLLRVPFSGGRAELFASNVAGFDLSRDGSRILVQQPHPGAPRAVDLALVPAAGPAAERVKPFVEEVDPSSGFADEAGRRVVYAIVAAGRGGVFLADVP
jgi:hypothetical protein